MSEEIKTTTEKPPFNVGDLVMMRKQHLKLRKFLFYPKEDVGIVLEMKKKNDFWLVNVYWQKYVSKKGKCLIKHHRLKKIRAIKNDE